MAGILTAQPAKGVYALLALLFETARLPLWILLFATRAGRPHPKWSFRQALGVHIVKHFLKHSSTIKVRTPLSLAPGSEGKRFTVIDPPAPRFVVGPLVDTAIKPEKIGGTWYPAPLKRSQADDPSVDVVLHFHGGAYVIGDGRDKDFGFGAATLLKHARPTHIFAPQYRLASNPLGQFPAALQDAVTSWVYLTETLGVPAHRITISGDSAGGNLAVGLLRYISQYGSSVGSSWPAAVWLWSPWVDVEAGLDPSNITRSPNVSTDYITAGFGHWGSSAFAPNRRPTDEWVSPLNNAFRSESPIWVQTGKAEVLYDDDVALAAQFEKAGSKVELFVQEAVPHDIILTGHIVGFAREAAEAAKRAGEWLKENRLGQKASL